MTVPGYAAEPLFPDLLAPRESRDDSSASGGYQIPRGEPQAIRPLLPTGRGGPSPGSAGWVKKRS